MGLSHSHSELMALGHEAFAAEIASQPDVLRQLSGRPESEFQGWLPENIQQVVALAEGSSWNVLNMAKPYLEAGLQTPIRIYTASQWHVARHCDPALLANTNTGLVFLSQSGNTGCLVNAAKLEAKGSASIRARSALITNTAEGKLREYVAHAFDIKAGKEVSIPATKTVTGSLYSLLRWGANSPQNQNALADLPDTVEQWLLALDLAIEKLVRALDTTDEWLVMSQGRMTLALPEIQLKLMEILGVQLHIDDLEGFKHGHKVLLGRMDKHRMTAIYLLPCADESGTEAVYADIEQHFTATQGHSWVQQPRVVLLQPENAAPVPVSLQALIKPTIIALPPLTNSVQDLFLAITLFQRLGLSMAQAWQKPLNSQALSKFVSVPGSP